MKNLFIPLILFVGIIMASSLLFSCTSTSVSEKTTKSDIPEPVEEELPFSVRFVQRLQALLDEGKDEEAINLFQELPAEYENDVELQLIHASLLVSSNRLEEASALTDKLLLIAPENKDVLMLSVMLAKASGDKSKKTATINQLLKADPNHPQANVELAQEQTLRRNFKQAKRYYEKSLAGDSNNVDALSGYGQVLYYLGEDKESKASLEKALEIDPDNGFAYSFLGKLAAEDQNYLLACEYVEKAIECDSGVYDYWLDYGSYLRFRGKFKEAEEAWLKAKDLQPDYFLGFAYLAGLYDEQNRFQEAMKMYQKVLELNPQYYFAYESLGIIAWHEKDYPQARAAFSKALEMNSENVSYPLMVAATYLKENKVNDCRNFLSKQLRNKDVSSVEYSMLRLYYDRINDSQVVRRVQNTSNRNLKGKMLYYLGLFYEINGNDVLSKKYYTEVVNLNSPMFFEFRLAEWAIDNTGK